MSSRPEYVQLAATILGDAVADAKDSDSLLLHADLAVAKAEWERVVGEDTGVLAQLQTAWAMFRTLEPLPWLYGGGAQLAWLAHRLSATRGLRLKNTDSFDAYVVAVAESYPSDRDIELVVGIIGLGVYGLSHISATMRREITRRVLTVIGARMEWEGDGCFVRVHDPVRNHLRGSLPVGTADLGVAHGNAGLVAYLGAVAQVGNELADEARWLLEGVFRWLLRQARPESPTVFGVSGDDGHRDSRSAWCYGDPGVSLTMRLGADGLAPGELRDAVMRCARLTALRALARPAARAGVADCCLCHGAAGLCYFGSRAAELFGIETASYVSDWYEYIRRSRLDGRLSYVGVGGRAPDATFLSGDSGVAGALLYCAHPDGAVWDERLLTRFPSAHGRSATEIWARS